MSEELHPVQKYLGREVIDVASKLQGIAGAVRKTLNGDFRIMISPPSDGSKPVDSWWVDDNLTDVLGDGVVDRIQLPSLEPKFKMGEEVEHKIANGIGGVITGVIWSMNGCVDYEVTLHEPEKIIASGPRRIELAEFELRSDGDLNEEVAEVAQDGSGCSQPTRATRR